MYKRSLNGFENDAGALFVSIYCSFVITPLTQLLLVSNLLRRITSRHHHSITPRFLSFVKKFIPRFKGRRTGENDGSVDALARAAYGERM